MDAKKINPAVANYLDTLIDNRTEPLCAFIYDLDRLIQRARHCVQTMPDACRLFYAIKANPDKQLLSCLAPIVHGFEAASIGEIRTIRSVATDIPVIFGGPGKKDDEIDEALEHRVSLIHVESLHELKRVSLLAERRKQTVAVLLRINLHCSFPEATVTMAGRATQFGIDQSLVFEAVRLAQSLPFISLEGFHMHSISNNLDARLHAGVVAGYLQQVKAWAEEFDLDVQYVNAGGGFGISYDDLSAEFDWSTFLQMLRANLAENTIPGATLLFEPGRYMVADCGYYAAEVIDIKCNHGKHFAIVRGGTHHFRLPASWQHNHPFNVVPVEPWQYEFDRPELSDCAVTIVGELCTPKDVLAQDVFVKKLRIGDVLLFVRAGAYGWTISHHDFLSHPHPQQHYIQNYIDNHIETEAKQKEVQ